MTRSRAELIRRNAEACEEATSSRCRCACGGSMHGKKHSDEWIRERELELAGVVDELEPELPL